MAIKHDFDPIEETGIDVPKKHLREALEAVAEFVKEQILSNTAEGKTSVKNGKWRYELTPQYAKRKGQESSADFANLELSGDMLDALETKVVGERVRIQISGSEEGKAEGNLKGTYGQSSPIKGGKYAREFMPYKRGQELSPDIMDGVETILERYSDD